MCSEFDKFYVKIASMDDAGVCYSNLCREGGTCSLKWPSVGVTLDAFLVDHGFVFVMTLPANASILGMPIRPLEAEGVRTIYVSLNAWYVMKVVCAEILRTIPEYLEQNRSAAAMDIDDLCGQCTALVLFRDPYRASVSDDVSGGRRKRRASDDASRHPKCARVGCDRMT